MEKIDLSFYKNHIVYFSFFDIYFKEYNIKKEEFLSKIGVTPSSYRKCRNGQLKIGDIIVEQIAGEIGYKVPSKKFINKFQELVNRIYNDVYYKIYDNYENDLINLDKLLSDKYLLEPIIKLLKVFLLTNSNKSLDIIQSQNKVLYDEIKKYEKFFYGDLLEIYEIVYLTNEEHINNHYLVKKYNSALPYYSLSTRSYLE